jgi:hypothetical protein
MEDKLTAVDWIIKQINNKSIGDGDYRTISDVFNQAKQMEKEQIEEAFNEGAWSGVNLGDSLGQDFYQKKYGSI